MLGGRFWSTSERGAGNASLVPGPAVYILSILSILRLYTYIIYGYFIDFTP